VQRRRMASSVLGGRAVVGSQEGMGRFREKRFFKVDGWTCGCAFEVAGREVGRAFLRVDCNAKIPMVFRRPKLCVS